MTTKTPGQVLYEAEIGDRPIYKMWESIGVSWQQTFEARAAAVITAHLSTHPPASGDVAEPVGYRCRLNLPKTEDLPGMVGQWWFATYRPGGPDDLEIQPLYAAPEAPTSQAPDTQRLDWLGGDDVRVDRDGFGRWYINDLTADERTLREVIDAAMSAAPEEPKP